MFYVLFEGTGKNYANIGDVTIMTIKNHNDSTLFKIVSGWRQRDTGGVCKFPIDTCKKVNQLTEAEYFKNSVCSQITSQQYFIFTKKNGKKRITTKKDIDEKYSMDFCLILGTGTKMRIV